MNALATLDRPAYPRVEKDERAELHALLQFIATDLPDPADTARMLPECAIAALRSAIQGRDGAWRLRHAVRDMKAGEILFSWGCVEARGPYLGIFGTKVRRCAIDMIASEGLE